MLVLNWAINDFKLFRPNCRLVKQTAEVVKVYRGGLSWKRPEISSGSSLLVAHTVEYPRC